MSYTIILPTDYGQMMVNRHDGNQTGGLLRTGKVIDDQEIKTVCKFIRQGSNAVDVGACFGAWSLGFAQHAKWVYCFEPQRQVFNQICGTLALNGIHNIIPSNVALGSKQCVLDVPKYDYDKQLEVGSFSLCGVGSQPQEAQPSTERVACVTLDDYKLENVSVIKIDAEGMDLDVLDGSKKTIAQSRPVIYIEILFFSRQQVLDVLKGIGYVDCLGDTSNMNMIVFPDELYAFHGMRPDGTHIIEWKGDGPLQEG